MQSATNKKSVYRALATVNGTVQRILYTAFTEVIYLKNQVGVNMNQNNVTADYSRVTVAGITLHHFRMWILL